MARPDLVNKKILLIAPTFFNYYKVISGELSQAGALVHFYDERNNPNSVEKIIYRTVPYFFHYKIDNYYSEIIKIEKHFSPDYVLFISPETIDSRSIIRLKKAFANAQFILYMWDSVENKNVKNVMNYFDKKLSFDRNDCEKYQMFFRPLFFTDQTSLVKENDFKYDISFVGTVHSDRASILYDIKNYCENNSLQYYFYLYVPGKLLFYLRMITNKYVRKLNKYIHLNPININEIQKIASSSKAVIDINHPKQTGLTMRTFEMLGLRKKIITTNSEIKMYDFYISSNQLVINREKFEINVNALNKPYINVDSTIYNKYSLYEWINDVFSLENINTFLR